MLHTLPTLIKATVVNRPSKTIKSPYVADIKLEDGTTAMCHTPGLGCCGLVATGRMTHGLTLLSIGVENGRYIDLVVDNCDPALFAAGVEGIGVYKNDNSETIAVESIRPISYSTMIMKARVSSKVI